MQQMPIPATGGDTNARKDVYHIITERIIEQLQNGVVPWRISWTTAGVPRNLISQRPYRGINVMLLAMLGYEHNLFLTYNQVKEIGATVKKGEKSHMVAFWNYAKDQHSETAAESMQAKKAPALKYYTVFNIGQCDNLPTQYQLSTPVSIDWNPLESCNEIVDDMQKQPKITNKENRAYYDPLKDVLNMPKYSSFNPKEAYYAAVFHQLVHSTGHRSRLDRKDLLQMAEFGSDLYSHEELVAEIGSYFLQFYAGITGEFEQSAEDIQGWLKALQGDTRLIFSASTQAQKATDFILNVQETAEDLVQKGEQ